MAVHRKSGGTLTLIFGYIFFMTVYRIGGMSTCHISEIEACMRYVEPFMRKSESIFPSYDDHTLGDVCNAFKQMEQCLEPIKPACSRAERQVYEGIEKANSFLCGSGLQQYRNYRVCFANAALTKDGNSCNFTYSKEMEKMRSNNKDPLEKRAKKLCKDTDDFMKCVKKAVLRHCGDDAASWVHNINIKVFSPFLDGIGCHDHRTSSRNNVPIAIILGVALAVVTILTSVVITSLLCHRKRRRAANSNNKNTGTSAEDDKRHTKSDLFSQMSDRKANIYSTSPRRKVAAVNGNIRKVVVVDENSDSEKLLNKDGSVKGEQLNMEQLKDGVNGSSTYEQILGSSPEKMAQEESCGSVGEHQEATGGQQEGVETKVASGKKGEVLTVWPLPVTPTKDNGNKVTTTPVKTATPTRPTRPAPPPPPKGASRVVAPAAAPPAASLQPMVAPSTIKIENEQPLLPSSGERWNPNQNESDLDSEGFPPPPPPICMDDLQNDLDDQRGQGQVRVNFVAPFAGTAHYSSRGAAAADNIDDLDQTEVKRAVPPMKAPMKHRSAPAGCRDSSLYEEEVDRLLEKAVPERGRAGGATPKLQLNSLV